MAEPVHIEIIPQDALSHSQYHEIVALCSRAYEEDFSGTLAEFAGATHVVAYAGRQLVSHALWIPRPLFYNDTPLQSAYVEAVATEPAYQGCGYASAILRALAAAIIAYDLGALSPSDPAFYARLGWEEWCGPLHVATATGCEPTPDERVMILRLPRTPALDLAGTLTALWRDGEIW